MTTTTDLAVQLAGLPAGEGSCGHSSCSRPWGNFAAAVRFGPHPSHTTDKRQWKLRTRAMAQADHSTDKTFRSFLAPDLLILDDLGPNSRDSNHSSGS